MHWADHHVIRETDIGLRAFVTEVTATLLRGNPHRTPGLGTFSTCMRKATADRGACRMAIFRASTELRAYADGGKPPRVSGSHTDAVRALVEAMLNNQGIDVPLLGRMAVVPVPGKKPRLIFHGAKELNDLLASTC